MMVWVVWVVLSLMVVVWSLIVAVLLLIVAVLLSVVALFVVLHHHLEVLLMTLWLCDGE